MEYLTPPDAVDIVHAFAAAGNTETTTMTVPGFPVFLKQAIRAIASEAGEPIPDTVAALLDTGLPFLNFPGGKDCLELQRELLRDSRDPQARLWLQQIVPCDVLTGGLASTRFGVRVDLLQHQQIERVAAVLGLPIGQGFMLALIAALKGSPLIPMDEADTAMDRMLPDLLDRCATRRRHMDGLLSTPQPEATTTHKTIQELLCGYSGW